MTDRFALAVHGGAGVVPRAAMTAANEAGYRAGLHAALLAGHAVLASGGAAIDAVTAAVVALEDDPLFNAGRGAVYTEAETQEMDAAIMRGADLAAGAVACVFGPRNPVLGARAVLEHAEHVLLAGAGAVAFCRERGVPFAPEAYFRHEPRLELLRRELERRRRGGPDRRDDAARHGTVGAVALDRHGGLAAATSTGGMTGKRPGRVGDTPIPGAGCWAEDGACAVSATGHGEFFLRRAVAHEVAARMRLRGEALETAAAAAIEQVAALGGSGGLIAIDATGRVAMPFHCGGMYRGAIGADGVARTAIHDEPLRTGEGTEGLDGGAGIG